jgi:hypothetical protein
MVLEEGGDRRERGCRFEIGWPKPDRRLPTGRMKSVANVGCGTPDEWQYVISYFLHIYGYSN